MKNMLKYTRPHMHGPAVRRLQEMGDLIGIDGGPNDGILGRNTHNVILRIQERLRVKQDGIVGPVTWAALIAHVDTLASMGEAPYTGVQLFDIRGKHQRPRLYSRQRTWGEITGVTIHQTGMLMPDHPMGWARLNAHIGQTQTGKSIIVNDFLDMIYHAQGLSKSTIGLEISGNFMGIQGKPRTLWRGGGGPHRLNLDMKLGLDETFEILKSAFEKNGEWKYIHAHRQSSKSRRADPGSEIWQEVAMVWAKRLGLTQCDRGPTFCKPKGLVIPVDWNPEYDGRY